MFADKGGKGKEKKNEGRIISMKGGEERKKRKGTKGRKEKGRGSSIIVGSLIEAH
jgi:hypothetical protein